MYIVCTWNTEWNILWLKNMNSWISVWDSQLFLLLSCLLKEIVPKALSKISHACNEKFKCRGNSVNHWHPGNFRFRTILELLCLKRFWNWLLVQELFLITDLFSYNNLTLILFQNGEKVRRQLGLPKLQMYWKAQRDKTNDLCDVRLAYNPLRKVLLHNKNAKSRGS